ncbi:MAG: hemerythrin domain-containing protein [Thermoleophilia bacterium]
MNWRDVLEGEHSLLLEVLDAAERECDFIDSTGNVHMDLVGDMVEFFRYFGDGLHDPKEEGLLYARCHRRGMTNDDEPLEQLMAEHEWCRATLDELQETLPAIKDGTTSAIRDLSVKLREYVQVTRCHIEVEETLFFDTTAHYLTEQDLAELSEEFARAHEEEVEEGVHAYYQELAHRVLAAETEMCG